jgi:hypothetical protein
MPVLVLVGSALLGGAVGCGSNAAPPAQPGTSTSTAVTVGHGAFAQCLGDHGVAEPAGAAGVDQGTWDKAMQACGSLAPGPGPGPAGP